MQSSLIDEILCFSDEAQNAIRRNVEYGKLSKEAVKMYNEFKAQLNNRQADLFEQFVNKNIDREGLATEIFFKEGFKAGVRLLVECLTD